jgi:hypothetical protein
MLGLALGAHSLHHVKVGRQREGELLLKAEELEHFEEKVMLKEAGALEQEVVHLEGKVEGRAGTERF